MLRGHVRTFVAAVALSVAGTPFAAAQGGGGGLPDSVKAHRWDVEHELESIAVVDRKEMISMRDGVRVAADVYYPKDASKKYPAIWSRTPYNFNFWDIQNGVPRDMTTVVNAIKRGYAYVEMQERGHFFSEGNYDILGPPVTDGVDEVKWMTSRKWSNGKIGTTGCSSTAEWQGAVAAQNTPGFAAMNVQGFGAGVGRVGPYYEQGNWYRGGAVQMLFIDWLYGEQNQVRPMMPKNATQADLVRESMSFDLAQHLPPVDWSKAFWTLPEENIMKDVGGPHGIFADSMPVATGGAMIKRAPNDPAWYRGGLFHDNMRINIPGLWFMSWYDVSVGPNLAMYNLVRSTAKGAAANQQWAVIAPTGHCWVHALHRAHGRRRARHGRRAARLQRHHVRVLRQVPEGRGRADPRHDAQGPLLHDGAEQVAELRHVAAARRRAGDVLSVERRKRQHAERRRRAEQGSARERQAGQVHLRPDAPRDVARRQRVLPGQRGRRRRDGSARDGGAARRARVHERTVHAGH